MSPAGDENKEERDEGGAGTSTPPALLFTEAIDWEVSGPLSARIRMSRSSRTASMWWGSASTAFLKSLRAPAGFPSLRSNRARW